MPQCTALTVLAVDRFKDPLQKPGTTDAQVPYIKWVSTVNTVSPSYP